VRAKTSEEFIADYLIIPLDLVYNDNETKRWGWFMSTQLENREERQTKTYPNYRVIMYNDDVHTFDFVIDLLCRTVPGMTAPKANDHAWEIHTTGLSIVAVAPFEVAEFYCEVFNEAGMQSSIEPDE
jgi:ATP-dependent Clp protease adaptor protein ClpS